MDGAPVMGMQATQELLTCTSGEKCTAMKADLLHPGSHEDTRQLGSRGRQRPVIAQARCWNCCARWLIRSTGRFYNNFRILKYFLK